VAAELPIKKSPRNKRGGIKPAGGGSTGRHGIEDQKVSVRRAAIRETGSLEVTP